MYTVILSLRWCIIGIAGVFSGEGGGGEMEGEAAGASGEAMAMVVLMPMLTWMRKAA